MTALDKAFIKVYSRDEPHPRVSAPHFMRQPNVAARRDTAKVHTVTLEAHSLGVCNVREDEDAAPLVMKIPLPQATPLRPAFEVDRVVWPHVCETLHTELGIELDAVLGEFAQSEGGAARILGLAGTSQGVGTTTLALTLAHQLCQQRSRNPHTELLLIDANLQDSDMARQLGMSPQVCWCESARQNGALADSLIESLHDRLAVMSIANGQSRASTRVNQQKLRSDIKVLAGCYRTIFVDFGAIKAADDSGMLAALGGCVESLLLVHDQRNAEVAQLEQAVQIAEQAELDVAGVIENFSVDSIRPVMVA